MAGPGLKGQNDRVRLRELEFSSENKLFESYAWALFSFFLTSVVVLSGCVYCVSLVPPSQRPKTLPAEDSVLDGLESLAFFYYLLLLTSRLLLGDKTSLLDSLWACNFAFMLFGFGIRLREPLIIGAAGCSVAIDQVMWYLDILGFLVLGKFPLGVCKYLTWPETPSIRRVTATHHVWFMPLCFWVLCVYSSGPSIWSWAVSSVTCCLLGCMSRLLTPYEFVTRVKPGETENRRVIHLNINLCYSCWKDVNFVPAIRRYDLDVWYKYLPWYLSIWNLGNLVLFLVTMKIPYWAATTAFR